MFEMLDVLIGFVLVMLIMSMAVTMLTQLIGSAILNLRGRALRIGTARLLALLDRGLTPAESLAIADHILRNPLVGEPPVLYGRHGLAGSVHREELVKLILDFAANGDAERAHDEEAVNEDALRDKIRRSLASNGIKDPAKVLQAIRGEVLKLEASNPEMSHSARLNAAILRFASSDFLSKLNSWFDQTIDRVVNIFTARIRIVTAIVALAVALVVHLDAIRLINRLSIDDTLRDQLVAAAVERVEQPDAATAPAEATAVPPAADAAESPAAEEAAAAPAAADEAAIEQDIRARIAAIRAAGVDELEGFGILAFPRSFEEWKNRWSADGGTPGWGELFMRLFGILLSAALLSLGAPFWYSTLGNLVKLRSMISRKDDAERAERQLTQAPAAPGVAPDPD